MFLCRFKLELALLLVASVTVCGLASAAPIEDDGKSGFLPPPPGGLSENPPLYKPMSPFDYESLVCVLSADIVPKMYLR